MTSLIPHEPRRRRQGVALCLSGGGFRAALFHLGALRRLNELGILSQVDVISSVSGGSIIAAHLAERIPTWPEPGTVVASWDEVVAASFRSFVRRNRRTGQLFRRLIPSNWRRPGTAIKALAALLQHELTGLQLSELPDRPRFIFSATDMAFGTYWIFERDRFGNFLAGYGVPTPEWTVARAAAASSCFPPVFDPMPLNLEPHQLRSGTARQTNRDELISRLCLTDGGVYDNLGLEPVWKTAGVVLVSDGGAPFGFRSDPGAIRRLFRYTSIIGNQAAAIRKRWLISSLATGRLEGAYWGVGSTTDRHGASGGYPLDLVTDVIVRVRTDLDAFSPPEIRVLENHGYLMADAAIQRRVPRVIRVHAPLAVPYPDWMDGERVRNALRSSDARTFLGRW
jgi:NTE family protein